MDIIMHEEVAQRESEGNECTTGRRRRKDWMVVDG